ncbi:MAG TPA: glycosyl hydrolase family 18 protein, partial [Anaerolineales bacterium]|nr:glycosyl hydrolase family 18 protein [Anaerolineales bacterium]
MPGRKARGSIRPTLVLAMSAFLAQGCLGASPATAETSSPTASAATATTASSPTPRPYLSPRTTPEVEPPPRIIGYFSSWGIYARNYHVKTIVTSGSAEKLTVINYAFAGPFDNRCILADPQADTRRIYGTADGVDGQGNGRDALRGHYGQLLRLKAMYPDLKVLISIGGWTLSADFSDAALPENRAAFVAGCL